MGSIKQSFNSRRFRYFLRLTSAVPEGDTHLSGARRAAPLRQLKREGREPVQGYPKTPMEDAWRI
ncbi:MAG: hypothetical protein JWP35_3984 [Caulobacter sp.]|nr:hypothetical protein [Caulobacter sp.]